MLSSPGRSSLLPQMAHHPEVAVVSEHWWVGMAGVLQQEACCSCDLMSDTLEINCALAWSGFGVKFIIVYDDNTEHACMFRLDRGTHRPKGGRAAVAGGAYKAQQAA